MTNSMIKLIFFTGLAFLFAAPYSSALEKKHRLSQDGKALYEIVVNKNKATEVELNAAEELRKYLGKICGADFKITNEPENKSALQKIYVGQTDFSIANGIDVSKLGREEWNMKTVGANLILAGGVPRGSIYAVYEFLEKYANCHWFAEDTESIPFDKNFTVPEINIKGSPAFWFRAFVGPVTSDIEKSAMFFLRNKYNYAYVDKKYGYVEKFGQPLNCHTFYFYSKDWPKDHPEYFSMDSRGKYLRAESGGGPGQICLTNPDVRNLIYEKLLGFIKNDRDNAEKNKTNYPKVYDVSHNDNVEMCVCPKCSALKEKLGEWSDVNLDFINDIAGRIKAVYPDVLVQAFAYTYTLEPPKTLKPADNVMIRICNLDAEFLSAGATSEILKPVTDKNNSEFKRILDKWASVSKHLSLWDYWVLYCKQFQYPYVNIAKITEDMKYYKKQNVENMFVECEYPLTTSFHQLKKWLSLKLMDNPDQDSKNLINSFMEAFYGNASEPMKKYLDYLENKNMKESMRLGVLQPFQVPYLNLDFFIEVNKLLDDAEQKASGNEKFLRHVSDERVMVDCALLNMWKTLEKRNQGKALPFDKDKILKRYKVNKTALIDFWNSREKATQEKADLEKEILKLDLSVPLPNEFDGRDAVDILWPDFKPMKHLGVEFADDKDAAGGKAMRLAEFPKYEELHKKPFMAELYNVSRKERGPSFEIKDVPADGKYHWYKIGTLNLQAGAHIFAHWTSHFQINIDKAFNPLLPDNTKEVYISVKLLGPSYVKGSTDKDSVWIDRILILTPENKNH